MTGEDLITLAYRRRGIVQRAGRAPNASELAEGLTLANEILDEWSARKVYAYASVFTEFTLTAGHQPHLIGPGLAAPDFAVPARPVRIESASLILTGGVDKPLNIRDADWWADKRLKSLQNSVPTDLYYAADFPNGALHLWGIPTVAYGLRLEMWTVLAQIATLATVLSLPPAYAKALELTLAEEIPTDVPMPVWLPAKAARARAAVQSNNDKSRRIASADYGTRGRPRGDFSWRTGGPV